MKNKFIALTLCAAVLITPMVKAGEHDNHAQKNSTARRIGFFLLHSASFLGGLGTTLIGTAISRASLHFRNLPEVEQLKMRQAYYMQERGRGNNDAASQKTADSLVSFKKHPSTAPIAGTIAIGGLAATIYGFQGLVKDVISLFK